MKKLLFFVLALVLIFTVSCSKNVTPTASDNSTTVSALAIGWHQLTQAQRNSAIITRAYQDNGVYTGLSCKVWMQNVVSSASGGATTLPTNRAYPYECLWTTGQSYIYYMNQFPPVPIANAQVGWIVQMYFKNLNTGVVVPHTMLIVAMYSTSMDVIDCNFVSAYTVGVHNMTFTYFYQHAIDPLGQNYRYSLYYVL